MFVALKDQELLRNVTKKPRHEVRMRKWVSQICLPDLSLDDKEFTITLDWEQLFSRFLADRREEVLGENRSSGNEGMTSLLEDRTQAWDRVTYGPPIVSPW